MNNFDYPRDISNLSDEKKLSFYLYLTKELTISNRTILSNDSLLSAEKLNRMKYINEVIHRIVNRMQDLVYEDQLLTEQDIWEMIKHAVDQSKGIGGEVGAAISICYQKANS